MCSFYLYAFRLMICALVLESVLRNCFLMYIINYQQTLTQERQMVWISKYMERSLV